MTVTNLDCRDAHAVEVAIEGTEPSDVEAEVLFEDQAPDMEVNAENADAFEAEDLNVDIDGDVLTVDLEPSTVAGITLQ